MSIDIYEVKRNVETKFIGLNPNTTSVKPVHIANGMFRAILDRALDTRRLFRFVFWQTAKGEVPTGHDMDSVYADLIDNGKLNPDIRRSDVAQYRQLLKKVVAADDAVYDDGMESYTAGYEGFVARDRIAQDGGELVAAWLSSNGSPLIECIREALSDYRDPITMMCLPLLSEDPRDYPRRYDPEKVAFLNEPITAISEHAWAGLRQAAETLALHLQAHPNKLLRLRLAVLFASFVIIRHLANLEITYVPGARERVLPFLLDFGDDNTGPSARASLSSYQMVCQSISRFYGWAFGQYIQQELFTLDELANEGLPLWKRHEVKNESKETWALVLTSAQSTTDPFTHIGQALYDMMAQESEGNPIGYLRQLGHRAGILWPPVNNQPRKRFVPQQDTLEMLIRSSMLPGETVEMPTLQQRLWDRFGIIIGGRPEDHQNLLECGIYQADSDALSLNRDRFAERLGGLDFARLLADGVLQVELEANHESR